MRTRNTTALAATMLLGTLAACSSGTDDQEATKASPVSTKAPAKASPSPAAPMPLGTVFTLPVAEDGSITTATVLGYEQGTIKPQRSADAEFGTKGYVWAAIELKVCNKKGNLGVTRYPWALAYTDGTRIEPSGVTYGDFPKPEYPYEATVKTGDCVRGKTVFPVPGNQRPERVLYTTDILPEPAEWAVPAK
ncbi:hypothetical protein [Streptomyces sp. SID3212]|uniref:hypothetical protein n=1 Tax=Streptomyces sp. SID3212 TaxID=2690259 RepID=UPI00136BF3EB|nr:hypothetical protein [Streptomyces sp. SID3212]MYV56522.1 hypothetical protein [Streptomyces sp. SID3212]